jgi:hypothetical protein
MPTEIEVNMERKVFRLRINHALAMIILMLIIRMLVNLALIFLTDASVSKILWFEGRSAIVMLVLGIATWYGTWYTVDLQTGYIELKLFGLTCRVYKIMNILSIEQRYNNIGYALIYFSRKRWIIREEYGAQDMFLFVRENEFLEMLTKQNPDIRINVGDKKAWYRIWDWDI